MRISDWSSDVCSSDLGLEHHQRRPQSRLDLLEQGRLKGGKVFEAEFGDEARDGGVADSRALREARCAPQSGHRIIGEQQLDDPRFGARQADAAAAQQILDRHLPVRWSPVRWSIVRSEEHTSEHQSLMRTSYAVFCLKKKKMKD